LYKLADSALLPWFYAQRCVKTLRTIHIATVLLSTPGTFAMQQLKHYKLAVEV